MLSDPCEKCGERAKTTECLTLDAWCMGKEPLCYEYARYLGQQEGYAKGARDITNDVFPIFRDDVDGWLKEKGVL